MEQKRQMVEGQQPIHERTLTLKRIFVPRWKPTPEQRLWIIRLAIILVFLSVLVVIGYRFEWTGFGDSVREVGEDKDLRRAKTLWDWMQLLVVPAALAIGGFWLANRAQKQRDKENEKAQNQRDKENREAQERRDIENEQRRQQELFLEQQRAQDAALQSYFDQVSRLILEKKLFATQPNDVHRTLARARTLTVLERLDAGRKRNVLRFLHESGLIKGDNPIIVLSGAKNLLKDVDLSGAQLTEANLAGVDLTDAKMHTFADLRRAVLTATQLERANLATALLDDANLTGANLIDARLLKATLNGADLTGAALNNANMAGSHLVRATMLGASLQRANLEGADLRHVDLTTANLTGANLRNADLTDAELTDAEMSRADLTGAKVTSVQLGTPNSLQGATMPDGSLRS